ncbi:MAG: hypothetical protein ACP5QK_09080 [Myxococcota bacterium]
MKRILYILFILIVLFISPAFGEEIPLNIGVGPALNYIPSIISEDQLLHYSLKLDIYAAIDREFIESHKSRIPKKYRGFVENKDELRVSYIFIPESIIFSPKLNNTGMYGINFRPISIGLPVLKYVNFKNRLNLGLNLTYIFIHSDKIFEGSGSMNFLRPGLNLQFDNIAKMTRKFLISFGVDAYFYIPQKIEKNSPILESGEPDKSIWFIVQGYIIFNLRLPYNAKI